MAEVCAVGSPANDSERKAIKYLATNLPDSYIIFHNLELQASSGYPYEYDLIVVGEHAVYAVEVKSYGKIIKGNAQDWELASGKIVKSPLPLNNKKARILKSCLENYRASLKPVWVESLVALTDDRVRVSLRDSQRGRVLRLKEAVEYMLEPQRLPHYNGPITPYTNLIRQYMLTHFGPLTRKEQIGEFRVLETIGNKDLYITLLAEHGLLGADSRFTLKVYRFDVYASERERQRQMQRLLRDAQALHQLLGHANVVYTHLPFLWEDNQIVLPTAWVDGYSLRGLIDEDAPMSLARKVDVLRQVCAGLHHTHSHQIIHRDLCPDNVIVPREGPVKLVNFDCARMLEQNHTIGSQVGEHLDKRYAAPEVLTDPSAASPASDQYAAGIVLFELLTGQLPYQDIKEVVAARGLPRLPSEIKPDLPRKADEVVTRMCALSPQQRYPGLAPVMEALATLAAESA